MDLFDRMISAMELLARSSRANTKKELSPEQRYESIKTPVVRKFARQFSGEFSTLQWEEQKAQVQRFLSHGSNRLAHLGVFLLGLTIHDAAFVDAPALDAMVSAFRGWSVTDAFCIEVLQPLLRRFTKDVLLLTDDWARDANQWKRRASVVVFVRKIGASGEYTRRGLAACERLISDPEDLVRKGIGWALKDLMRGDKETVLDYVIDLRRRGVTSVITLYALRDIKGKEREHILAIR